MLILLIAPWWLGLCSGGGVNVEVIVGNVMSFICEQSGLMTTWTESPTHHRQQRNSIQTNKKHTHTIHTLPFSHQEVNDDVLWLPL